MAALRIGIVGSRFAAHLHLLAYRRVYGVEARLAAVTSPTAERREAFARETGATAYRERRGHAAARRRRRRVLAAGDARAVALEAIDAGKHVFIEKPFTGAFDKRARAPTRC